MSANTPDVLIVEDRPEDAEMVKMALERRIRGVTVQIARDGAEAIEFLTNPDAPVRPRLVLLDLKMPRVDGFEVLEMLRDDERTVSIPVVVMSSSALEPDVRRAYALGANSYVVKPTDFDEFRDTLGAVGEYWLHIDYGVRLEDG